MLAAIVSTPKVERERLAGMVCVCRCACARMHVGLGKRVKYDRPCFLIFTTGISVCFYVFVAVSCCSKVVFYAYVRNFGGWIFFNDDLLVRKLCLFGHFFHVSANRVCISTL